MKITDDKNPCCPIFNKQKYDDCVQKSDSKNNKRVYFCINKYRDNNLPEESDSSSKSNRKHKRIKITDTSMDRTTNNLIIATISAIIIAVIIVFVLHYFLWESPIKEDFDIKSVKTLYNVQILDEIITPDYSQNF